MLEDERELTDWEKCFKLLNARGWEGANRLGKVFQAPQCLRRRGSLWIREATQFDPIFAFLLQQWNPCFETTLTITEQKVLCLVRGLFTYKCTYVQKKWFLDEVVSRQVLHCITEIDI